jgi:hypothetical protein
LLRNAGAIALLRSDWQDERKDSDDNSRAS